jgi:hypothetical protein
MVAWARKGPGNYKQKEKVKTHITCYYSRSMELLFDHVGRNERSVIWGADVYRNEGFIIFLFIV